MPWRILESIIPAKWRRIPEANPERNDATLARVSDTNDVYRACVEHAHAKLDDAVRAALQPVLPAGACREYLAGQAYGLLDLICTLEDTRVRARAYQAAEELRRAAVHR